MDDKKFYSIADLADLFGVSRLTIHRRIKAGDIKAIKFGNLVRVPAASLKKYLVEA
jgi:excisionase family DNA binding protein